MLVAKFSCPSCGTVLKTGNPQPAGKMVKCPRCNKDFSVSAEALEDAAAPAVHFEPGGDHPEPPRNDNTALVLVLVILACVGLLAGGGALLIWYTHQSSDPKVVFKPDNAEVPMPVMVRGAGAGPPVKPRQIPRPGRPLADKPQRPGALADSLPRLDLSTINLAALSLGNLEAKAAAELDVLKYLPPDANFIVAMDGGNLMSHPQLARWLSATEAFALDSREIVEFAAAMTLPLTELRALDPRQLRPAVVFVAKSRADFDLAGFAQKVKGEKAEKGGRVYYRFPIRDGVPGFAYAPTSRIVVFGEESRLDFALAVDPAQAALRPELKRVLDAIGKAHWWMCLAVDEPSVAAFNAAFKPLENPLVTDESRALVSRLLKLDAVGLGVRLNDRHVSIGLCAGFPEQAQAEQVAQLAQDLWAKQAKQQLDGLKLPPVEGLVAELGQGLRLDSRNQVAVASVNLTFKSLDGVLKLIQQLQGLPAGAAKPPG